MHRPFHIYSNTHFFLRAIRNVKHDGHLKRIIHLSRPENYLSMNTQEWIKPRLVGRADGNSRLKIASPKRGRIGLSIGRRPGRWRLGIRRRVPNPSKKLRCMHFPASVCRKTVCPADQYLRARAPHLNGPERHAKATIFQTDNIHVENINWLKSKIND